MSIPEKLRPDPTGYLGPLRYLEVMLGGKFRPGSGVWAEAGELTRMVHSAAFSSNIPLKDSHGQLAHYARSFELFDKVDADRKAELLARLDSIPHLADFHVDIDFDGELERSRTEAVKLVDYYESLGLPEAAIGIRFSGKKGFDISVPWQLLGVSPQGVIGLNYVTYKILAQELIAKLDLHGVDVGLYRKNGTIRLENTVHPSGLHKVRLFPSELRGDVDAIRELAQKPRRPLYPPEVEHQVRAEANVGLRSLYLVAQARADAQLIQTKELGSRPLDPEAMAELGDGLTPCLRNLLASSPSRGMRNETLFHAAMMLKYIGKDEAQARALGREWLGSSYNEVGGDGTIRSVYSGPYSGGVRWFKEMGFSNDVDCRDCPVCRRRMERDARMPDEPPVVVAESELPTIAEQREKLARDFKNLEPYKLHVFRVPAGVGKTHAALEVATQIAAEGGRALFFTKDTLKATSLAADLIDELRENHDYGGKVQILYGRNERNCEVWDDVQKIMKKGYSVGQVMCSGCFARHHCPYYDQWESAYEPGIYIAPHAMLPILFDDERRGFATEFQSYKDEDGSMPVGGPLKLIVVDEDALDVLIDRFFVGSYHLENEVRQRKRYQRQVDKLTGTAEHKPVTLDKNWLRIIGWLQAAIRVPGPLMPALASVATADGGNLRATLLAINPALIIDPDYKRNKGHKPFTVRLYQALTRELPRLKDGNFTMWATGTGLEALGLSSINFPSGVPVAILDAYANEEVYRRFFRAAGVNRLPVFLDYPVREQPSVTYVLGANLLTSTFKKAEGSNSSAVKIDRVMKALQALTSDGVETYVVAKRDFFASDAWKRWEPLLPNCVAEGDAGQLYYWRGRGINAASGKRVAILQVPNFHPSAVLAEASVLFADEPRLDDQRVRVESDVLWAPGVEARAIKVDRTVYADDRLNLINERYRMDELVQMALRGRSLTTGAEIIIFADLPDPRLPASRVYTVAELADDEARLADESRALVYDALRDLGELNIEALQAIGVVQGEGSPTPLRQAIKRVCPDAYRVAKTYPIDIATARTEISA